LGALMMLSRVFFLSFNAFILAALSAPSWAAPSNTSSAAEAEKVLRQLFRDFVEVCTIDEPKDNPLSHELFELNPEPLQSIPEGMGNSRMIVKVRSHWKHDTAKFFTGFQRITNHDFPVCGVFTPRNRHFPLPYRQLLSDTFPGNSWGTEISRDRPWFKRFHGNHTWRQREMESDSVCLELSRNFVVLFRAPFCVLE